MPEDFQPGSHQRLYLEDGTEIEVDVRVRLQRQVLSTRGSDRLLEGDRPRGVDVGGRGGLDTFDRD